MKLTTYWLAAVLTAPVLAMAQNPAVAPHAVAAEMDMARQLAAQATAVAPVAMAAAGEYEWAVQLAKQARSFNGMAGMGALAGMAPLAGIPGFAMQASARSPEARAARDMARNAAGDYSRGSRALDKRDWAGAVQAFDNVIRVNGSRLDGALYWKAYALNKLGRREEALSSLAQLGKDHPESNWLNDAKALEVEVHNASGTPVSPEAENNEELKLLALNGLMQTDPERMLPLVEKMLHGPASPRVKEQALFVLAQSNSPKARAILGQLAKGGGNPDLQIKAVEFLAIHGGKESGPTLADVYATAKDDNVREAVLRAYMISGQKDRLLAAARSEKSVALRGQAIQYLGAAGARDEIWQMYQAETSPELRGNLIQAMMISGMSDRLLEVAKGAKDPKTRKDAIQGYAVSGGNKGADVLVSIYSSEQDRSVKETIIHSFMMSGSAKPLVEIARQEKNPELKKTAVQTLSLMHSPEATEYLMELLK
ncbi:MAG: HEAT repeat domain-containing protein [Bryobacteraceae bacterium]